MSAASMEAGEALLVIQVDMPAPPALELFTMTYYGSQMVVQNYNVMGVAKAAPESRTLREPKLFSSRRSLLLHPDAVPEPTKLRLPRGQERLRHCVPPCNLVL